MRAEKLILLILAVAAMAAWYVLDLGHYLSLQALKQGRSELARWRDEQPVLLALAFFLIYVALLTLMLPVATAMSLAAGAIFGFWIGLALASFAFSLGALLSFLAARYLLRDSVRRHMARRLAVIDRGFAESGAWYLFSLRLLPLVPPLLINPVMGLTRMKALPFYLLTQAGSLLGTVIYVNAGTQLAQLDSLQDIWSPFVLGSLGLLVVFALGTHGLVKAVRRRSA